MSVDLKSLLEEATRAEESVTVILNQRLGGEIRALEERIEKGLTDGPKRAGRNTAAAAVKELTDLRERMAASEMTLTFTAPTYEQREQIRKDMEGRDNLDELDLRFTAAMCSRITSTKGDVDMPVPWSFFRDLRDHIGVVIYAETIKATSDRVAGGEWSVPFSQPPSPTPET